MRIAGAERGLAGGWPRWSLCAARHGGREPPRCGDERTCGVGESAGGDGEVEATHELVGHGDVDGRM